MARAALAFLEAWLYYLKNRPLIEIFSMKTESLAVVDATGAVGQEILKILAERDFPAGRVIPLAASAAKGRKVSYGEDELVAIEDLGSFDFSRVSLCISAAKPSVTKDFAPKARKAGCCVIDAGAAFRFDSDVSLIAAGVNDEALRDHKGIIANPSALGIMLASVLKPLHDHTGVLAVIATGFRAVCDQGHEGMDELFAQTRAIYVNDALTRDVFHKQIAFNVIPHVGSFMEDGFTSEEWGLGAEIKKIIAPEIKVSASLVYAPVFIGESLAVHIQLEDDLSAAQARNLLRQASGVQVVDHRHEDGFVTPAESVGEDSIFVSRMRDDSTGLWLWVTTDTLRKGSALNAVQIAELMIAAYL